MAARSMERSLSHGTLLSGGLRGKDELRAREEPASQRPHAKNTQSSWFSPINACSRRPCSTDPFHGASFTKSVFVWDHAETASGCQGFAQSLQLSR